MITAVDTELNGIAATLRALASSYSLQIGDLPAFHRQAVRLLSTQKEWRSIILALPSGGERVLDSSVPFDTLLSTVDRTGFDEALCRNEPVIGNLAPEDSDYRFAVLMPVEMNDKVGVLIGLALTGYGSEDARQKAKGAGFDEYLVKPVSPRELAELIESRLDARSQTEAIDQDS